MDKEFIVNVPNYGKYKAIAKSHYQAKIKILKELGLDNEVSARSFTRGVGASMAMPPKRKKTWEQYLKDMYK